MSIVRRNVTLDQATWQAVQQAAREEARKRREDVSAAEVVREAVQEWLAGHRYGDGDNDRKQLRRGRGKR